MNTLGAAIGVVGTVAEGWVDELPAVGIVPEDCEDKRWPMSKSWWSWPKVTWSVMFWMLVLMF